MILIAHAVYYYAVLNFGDTDELGDTVWSVLAQVYLATWCDSIVRAVYCRRIWLLSGRNHILACCIAITSAFTFVFATIFSTKMLLTMHTPAAAHNVFYIYITFAGVISSDFLITTSLCLALNKHRSMFQGTNSLISIIILYTINTSLLTTICALVALIAAASWPKNMIYLALIFTLSKLYVGSLLSALNSRHAIWEKCFGGSGGLQRSSIRMPGQTLTSQPIVVKMEREVENDDNSSRIRGDSDIELQKQKSDH
ncbi:hypothetical protein H0H87_001021 [Tephrocybe sp. NHM501043]|nr:hypothetical protein H0H87_001021 [Tephrocybe sp. NHM501043]